MGLVGTQLGHNETETCMVRACVTHHGFLSKTILQGTLEDGQRRGRQRKCWMDNIKEFLITLQSLSIWLRHIACFTIYANVVCCLLNWTLINYMVRVHRQRPAGSNQTQVSIPSPFLHSRIADHVERLLGHLITKMVYVCTI